MKITLGQLLIEGGEPERNLERAGLMVCQAAQVGSDLLLLPETLDFAWTHPSALNEAEPIPGRFSDQLCRYAKEAEIFICAGLTERCGDKNYNAALLIDRSGTISLVYHKINLLQVELPYYQVGTTLRAVDTEFGRIGVNICADNYIDGLPIGHTLARMGAQIILSPSSWTSSFSVNESQHPYREKWLKPFLTLAKLYGLVVASSTSVGYIVGGPYEGTKMVGCSLVVGANGLIAEGPFNEFAGAVIHTEFEVPEQDIRGTAFGERLRSLGYRFDDWQWEKIRTIH